MAPVSRMSPTTIRITQALADWRSGSTLANTFTPTLSGHSVDEFPVRTAEEFLEFLRAAHAGAAIQAFLAGLSAALAFVQAPKPIPSSFARESYFTVTAFKFTAAGQ